MADNNINQDNPFEGVFDRQAQERQQANEQIQMQREQLNNERKLQAQRLLANKQGNELAKILSVINPSLAPLGQALGTTAEFAKIAYEALDDMSTKLSKASASAKLLGISIAGLEGAGEMHKDILVLKNKWSSFIEELELGVSQLYNNAKNGVDYKSMSHQELGEFGLKNIWNIPVLIGMEEELERRKRAEEEVTNTLGNYKFALESQIDNIERNGTLTRTELSNLSSNGVNALAGAGVSGELDQNRWTSLMLGYTEKIFKDMDGSINFDDIYNDVLSYFISGETEGLNKYGYGLTEESFYGYAHKYANMDLKSTKYRDDKMIETRFNFFDMWTSSTDDLKESMYDLGYEVKNNTNAIQKWQMLETVSGISTDKGRSSYKDYFAVDQNGNDITDKLFGTETERFNAEIRENIKKLGDTSHMSLDEILTAAGMTLPTIPKSTSGAPTLDDVVEANIAKGVSSGYNTKPMTLDQLVASNSQKTLDDVVKNIHVNITTSDNLKAEVMEIASKQLWDTVQDSFSGGNVAKGILSLPGKILGMN